MTTSGGGEGQPGVAAECGALPLVLHPAIPSDTPQQQGNIRDKIQELQGASNKSQVLQRKKKQKAKKEKDFEKGIKCNDKKTEPKLKVNKSKEKKCKKKSKNSGAPIVGSGSSSGSEGRGRRPALSGAEGEGQARRHCKCPNVRPYTRPLWCQCPCARPYTRLLAAAAENLWYEANSRRFHQSRLAPPQQLLLKNRRVASKLKRSVMCRCVSLCQSSAKRANLYSQEEVSEEARVCALQWRGQPREMCHCSGRPCVCSIAPKVPPDIFKHQLNKDGRSPQSLLEGPTPEGPALWHSLQQRLDKDLCYDYMPSPFQAGRVARFCLGLGTCFRMSVPPQPCKKLAVTSSRGTDPAPPLPPAPPCFFAKSPDECDCISDPLCSCHNATQLVKAMDDGDKHEEPIEVISKPLYKGKDTKKDKNPKKADPEAKKRAERQRKVREAKLTPPPAAPEVGDLLLDRTWVHIQGLRLLNPGLSPEGDLPKHVSNTTLSNAQTFCDRGRAETFANEVVGRVVGQLRLEATAARAQRTAPAAGCICPTSPCRCRRHAMPASKPVPKSQASQNATETEMQRTWRNWQGTLKMEISNQPPVPDDPTLESMPVSCVSVDTCMRHGARPPGGRKSSVCVPACARTCVITGSLTPASAGDATPLEPPPAATQERGGDNRKQLTWAATTACVCYITAHQYDLPPEARLSSGKSPPPPDRSPPDVWDNLYWFFKDRRTGQTQTSMGDQVPSSSDRQLSPRDVILSPEAAPPPPTALKRIITVTGYRLSTAKRSLLNWLYDCQDTIVKSVEIQCDLPVGENYDYDCECLPMENLEENAKCMNKNKRLCQQLLRTGASSTKMDDVTPFPPPPAAMTSSVTSPPLPESTRTAENGLIISWLAPTTPDGHQNCVHSKRRKRCFISTAVKGTYNSIAILLKGKKQPPEECVLRSVTGNICPSCNRIIPCTCCLTEAGVYRECNKCKEDDSRPSRRQGGWSAPTSSPGPCGWVTSVKDRVKCNTCSTELKTRAKQKPNKIESMKTFKPKQKTYNTYVIHNTSSYLPSLNSGSEAGSTSFSSSTTSSSITFSASDSSETSLCSKEQSDVTKFQNSVHFTYYGQTNIKEEKPTSSKNEIKNMGSIVDKKNKTHMESYKRLCTCDDNRDPTTLGTTPENNSIQFVYEDEKNVKDGEGTKTHCSCLATVHGRIKCLSCNKDVEDLILQAGMIGETREQCECWSECKVQDLNKMDHSEEALQQPFISNELSPEYAEVSDGTREIDPTIQGNRDAMRIRALIESRISQCFQSKWKRNPKLSLKHKIFRLFNGFRGVLPTDDSESIEAHAGQECMWKFGSDKVCPSSKQDAPCTCQGEVRGATCETYRQRVLHNMGKSRGPVSGKKNPPPPSCGWLSKDKDSNKCDACNTKLDFIRKEIKFESILRNEFKPKKEITVGGKDVLVETPLSLAQPKSAPIQVPLTPEPPPCVCLSTAPQGKVEKPKVYPTDKLESRTPPVFDRLPETQQKQISKYSTKPSPALKSRLARLCECRVTKSKSRKVSAASKNLSTKQVTPPPARSAKGTDNVASPAKLKDYSKDNKSHMQATSKFVSKEPEQKIRSIDTKDPIRHDDSSYEHQKPRLPASHQSTSQDKPQTLEKNNPKKQRSDHEPQDQGQISVDVNKNQPATKKGVDSDSLRNSFGIDDKDLNANVIPKSKEKNVTDGNSCPCPRCGYTGTSEGAKLLHPDTKSGTRTSCECHDTKRYNSPKLTQIQQRAYVLDDGSRTPPLPKQKILGRNSLTNFFINENNYNEQFRRTHEQNDNRIEETDIMSGTLTTCSQRSMSGSNAGTPLSTPPCDRKQACSPSKKPAAIDDDDDGNNTPPLCLKYTKI